MLKIIFALGILAATVCAQPSLTIDCTFEDASGWHIFDPLYTCEVNSLSSDITEPETVVTAVTGVHADAKLHQNVQAVRFKNLAVNYFPRGLHKFFPNLVAVSVLACHLKEVRQSDLQPFPRLKYLNLYNNDLRVVRANLFAFNEDIEVIGLHYNDIKSVDAKTFERLPKLKFLWLVELNEERV